MKKELAYIKERYKKQRNVFSNNGYKNYEHSEVNKIKKLIDSKYNSKYSYRLFDEFGSFIKVKNHIDDNVGYDKFKEIYEYCIDTYTTYDNFVSYVKYPNTFIYNKKVKKKSFIKKLFIGILNEFRIYNKTLKQT